MDYYRGAQKLVQPIIADMHMFNLNKPEINIRRTIVLKQPWALQENG
jgi:hypothetical protein